MPYSMMIYPDEEKMYPYPKTGDIFAVVLVKDAIDFHWGKGKHIELVPVPPIDFKEIADVLKRCQVVINGLTVLRDGISYQRDAILELSNKISVAISKLEVLQK